MDDVTQRKVVVVGGGAAGMLAAWAAAKAGAHVTLLEKMERLGTKILISGGGKCNLCHAGPMDDVRNKFRHNEANFLRNAFRVFTNDDYLKLLTDKGLEVYTRPDGRIVPEPPADAKDVVEVMEAIVREAGVNVVLGAKIHGLLVTNDKAIGVEMDDGSRIGADALIIAVGGSSYPLTGCTGDGWKWMASLGHTVVPLTAALAPLYLEESPNWAADWSGVSLRDCVLRARAVNAQGDKGKERMRWRGDMLFTHKGISGPVSLGVAREIAEAWPESSLAEVDLFPDMREDQLREEIDKWCLNYPRRSVGALLESVAPARLARPIARVAMLDMEVKGAYFIAKARQRLVVALKGWVLGKVRAVPLERGEVVAGGVALGEVDNRTMMSRKISELYLCGEMLDIAGPVGAYNLQAAWSTGFVAGQAAAALPRTD